MTMKMARDDGDGDDDANKRIKLLVCAKYSAMYLTNILIISFNLLNNPIDRYLCPPCPFYRLLKEPSEDEGKEIQLKFMKLNYIPGPITRIFHMP